MVAPTAPTVPASLPSIRDSSSGRKGRRDRGRHDRTAYLFLAPWLVGMLFTVIPFGASLYLSFTDYNLLSAPQWIGLDNFVEMAGDRRLRAALAVTFIYTFVSVPLSLVVALAVAAFLNRGVRGLPVYRAIFYLPSLLGSSVAVVMLWRAIFGAEGVINKVLAVAGLPGASWVSQPDTALGVLITLNVWTFGAPMVIFLAALRQVPTVYYEAAAIDGASRWRRFRSITVPMISPIIFFNLVLSLIGSLQTFTQGYVMSGGSGGPADSTLFYNLYLYQKGFTQFSMGYASAMAWLLLLIVAAFTGINFLAQRYWVFYEK